MPNAPPTALPPLPATPPTPSIESPACPGVAKGGAQAATAEWVQSADGSGATLKLGGDWRGVTAALPSPPASASTDPEAPGTSARAGVTPAHLRIDASALRQWDARLTSALWQLLSLPQVRHAEPDLSSLPEGLQRILKLALPAGGSARAPVAEQAQARGLRALAALPFLRRVGRGARASSARMQETLGFVGDTLVALARLPRKSDMRWADLAWQIEQTGPRSLPIVALVSLLVGLILAYTGAAQLEQFGAQSYTADLVTVGAVREIAALLTGIVLAGRVGAAFAAQLASMRANEEIDSLRTLGIDPVQHLVLPRVLALALVAPLLVAMAALVGILAGWGVAVIVYGVTPLEYAHKSVQALTGEHVFIGLVKGTVYAVLVGLAGCRQGLNAGRSALAVGEATTTAVVQSIVWITVAASVLTIVFQRLGW